MVVKYCDGLCRTDCNLHVQNFFSNSVTVMEHRLLCVRASVRRGLGIKKILLYLSQSHINQPVGAV